MTTLDPVKFIERHNNLGAPNPSETKRLIDTRRARLAKAKTRQEGSVSPIRKAARWSGFASRPTTGEPSMRAQPSARRP